MVSFREPQTLVRAGYYPGELEEAVKNLHEKLFQAKSVLGNTVQYATFNKNEPYLLIVSQQIQKLQNPATGHNTLLTITSYSENTNTKAADSFEEETGITLDIPVPDWLMANYNTLNLSFHIFEKNPELAMAFLMKKG
jgi:hypothetical protein